MLTVTLTIAPLKYCQYHVDLVMNNIVANFHEIHPCILEIGENFLQECLFDLTIYGLAETLIFDLYQFIFVPNCTKFVNLVKFSQAVYKTSC